MPGIYSTGGVELLEMTSDGALAVYGYSGEGQSPGIGGANAAAYVGVVANLEDADAYAGHFAAAGFTVSFLEEGVTGFYFWSPSADPFSPYATQGLVVGWAPGAEASLWTSNTYYIELASTGR
jgi:hypothetical protein